jgi:hypothetical protein
VTCTSAKKGHKKRCHTTLTSAPKTFTTESARARLTRGGRIYAVGTLRAGRLSLRARRVVRAGRYTLRLTRRQGRRRIITHEKITIA